MITCSQIYDLALKNVRIAIKELGSSANNDNVYELAKKYTRKEIQQTTRLGKN